MRPKWFALWFVVNAVMLAVPTINAIYFWKAQLSYLHPSVPRFNSDGDDALGIPVGIVFFQTLCILLFVNLVGFCAWLFYKRWQHNRALR